MLDKVLNTNKKYNYIINENVLTNLDVNRKIFKIETAKPKYFKYHYFIYENFEYIVKFDQISDNKVTFYESSLGLNIEVELEQLYELAYIKNL